MLSQTQYYEAGERRVGYLNWDEVGSRLALGAPAILPIGAGAKQHGLHLPMNTDQIQAEWIAERIATAVDGLIWPTLTFGYYPAFTGYPGSLSLTPRTFERLVLDLTNGIFMWCRSKILIVDTGLSTHAPIGKAIARSLAPSDCVHLKVYDGPSFRDTVATLKEQPHGSHADEIETSIMLALAPTVVDMRRAEPSKLLPQGVAGGPLTRSDPDSPNFSASGSFGSPQLASREKGEQLLAAMTADAIEVAVAALQN